MPTVVRILNLILPRGSCGGRDRSRPGGGGVEVEFKAGRKGGAYGGLC